MRSQDRKSLPDRRGGDAEKKRRRISFKFDRMDPMSSMIEVSPPGGRSARRIGLHDKSQGPRIDAGGRA
jgi:hypothetical protein